MTTFGRLYDDIRTTFGRRADDPRTTGPLEPAAQPFPAIFSSFPVRMILRSGHASLAASMPKAAAINWLWHITGISIVGTGTFRKVEPTL